MAAQSMKPAGTSAKDFVPDGWEVKEARGDLNKDGLDDLVIIATPDDAENLYTRDDGYVFNFNQPVLGICLGSADGRFRLWKEYGDVMNYQKEEYLFVESSLEITPRGTLQICLEYSASAGSSETTLNTYTFRFQNGDMMLIGKDEYSMSRYSGESEEVSCNYLTRKCKTTKSNAFDPDVKDKVAWTTLPKAPLKRLGDFMIE